MGSKKSRNKMKINLEVNKARDKIAQSKNAYKKPYE